jgi:tetratricopeptide (TPR) repeat protein
MSEQLLRKHREFVEQTLAPYVLLSQEYVQGSWDAQAKESPQFQLACLLADRHFHSSLKEGTQILFEEIPQQANFHEYSEDWNRFIEKVRLVFESLSAKEWIEDGGEFWQAMQYALEISPRLMQAFYALGLSYYSQLERESTLAIMGLVSLLNPLLFEPWLVQGMLYFEEKKIEMALFCLTLAAIVSFEHPAAHLYFAKCYLYLGDTDQATRCLHIAKSFLEEGQSQWHKVCQQIETQMRRG